MQTFLPYSDFAQSAQVLDMRRLGKQRVEAMQILNVLQGRTTSWSRHPAVLMWKGYENALALYMNTVIAEWVSRGYRNNMGYVEVGEVTLPPWVGDPEFHASHRSNLLRKDFAHYSKFGWTEPLNLPYLWPRS